MKNSERNWRKIMAKVEEELGAAFKVALSAIIVR